MSRRITDLHAPDKSRYFAITEFNNCRQLQVTWGALTNGSSKETSQRHAKQSGAVEACWAHNPEVRGSKPRSAMFFSQLIFEIFLFQFLLTFSVLIYQPEKFSFPLLKLEEQSSGSKVKPGENTSQCRRIYRIEIKCK